jgi:uncharacterized membrane protein
MSPLKAIVVSVLLLTLVTPSFASGAATVHGAVYEWHGYELLDDVIVEVNSTPVQTIVAKYGIYSFYLTEGSYRINAYYYQGNNLELSAEKIIMINDDGDYIIDLLLYPAYESPFWEDNDNITTSIEEGTKIVEEDRAGSVYLYMVPVFLVLFLVIYAIHRGENNITSREQPEQSTEVPMEEEIAGKVSINEENTNEELPEDLNKIVEIIRSSGGRITQKELRQKVDYSEAKVSLMVADLENRGIIRKFKKGRGNIIVLSPD